MTTDRFKEPDGLHWGRFTNGAGEDVRYARLPAKGESRGTVVLLQGFRESIEKYHEVTRELHAQGLDVWLMDWPGQGGSERFVPDAPQRAHSRGYDSQIETLRRFTDTVVEKNGKPLMMMAHSMGAHIGLRFMHDYPDVFDSAMLTAPMFDIMTGSLPRPLARQMAKFASAGGYLEKYVPGGGDWRAEKHVFDGNNKTGDAERFENGVNLLRDNDALKIGDPTYGWIYHTFKSIDILNDETYLKNIKTPVLMQVSGRDTVVSISAQARAAALLPDCRRVDVAGARHEVWFETDALRDMWSKAVRAFIDERTAPPAPPSVKKPDPSAPKR